jgi:hypothetical protein
VAASPVPHHHNTVLFPPSDPPRTSHPSFPDMLPSVPFPIHPIQSSSFLTYQNLPSPPLRQLPISHLSHVLSILPSLSLSQSTPPIPSHRGPSHAPYRSYIISLLLDLLSPFLCRLPLSHLPVDLLYPLSLPHLSSHTPASSPQARSILLLSPSLDVLYTLPSHTFESFPSRSSSRSALLFSRSTDFESRRIRAKASVSNPRNFV